MKRFTIRSSSEWNAITARRPPGASTSSAPASAASSAVSSSFVAMRSAWKVRVAGWISRPRRPPSAPATISASRVVVSIGARSRSRDNRPRDAATPGLFAVAPDQVGQLALREGIHQIARRSALLGIEAHVERSLVTEGEPSLRLIELERRQPEIEQDAVERRNPSLSGNDGEIGKVGADRDEALADAWVLLQRGCAVDRGGIGVEGENDPVRR